MFNVVASDKEHDFVRLVTDFVSQLGLQLNVSKLIEVDAHVLDYCNYLLFLTTCEAAWYIISVAYVCL